MIDTALLIGFLVAVGRVVASVPVVTPDDRYSLVPACSGANSALPSLPSTGKRPAVGPVGMGALISLLAFTRSVQW